jgi:serine/threonine-protein phosphatase 2A activator
MEKQELIPKKEILTPKDLERFQASDAHTLFVSFVTQLNDSVRNLKNTGQRHESDIIKHLKMNLETLKLWIDEFPPHSQGISRFGNTAFREWLGKVENERDNLFDFIPQSHRKEITFYFAASFGDKQRIDYGTGHEANFICFLLCLNEINLVDFNDYPALVLDIFWNYILLVRKLCLSYWLEPAGSHGVWGLDDYNFLPFYFGSSQLAGSFF